MKSKNTLLFLLLITLTWSCKKGSNSDGRDIVLNDTITTRSGLKYIFLEEGNGQKIENGSKVKAFTQLYINDNPEVFWSTATSADSVFEFIHGNTKLIDGFAELNNYLLEGDKVIAIIPDSLAYKNEEKNGVPAGSTLIYKPYEVRFVSTPKAILKDTLIQITKSEGIKKAISHYETIINGDQKSNFHTDIQDLYGAVEQLFNDSLYSETGELANRFLKTTTDKDMIQGLSYYKLLALEAEGKFEEALQIAQPLSKQAKNQEFWHNKTIELTDKTSTNSNE